MTVSQTRTLLRARGRRKVRKCTTSTSTPASQHRRGVDSDSLPCVLACMCDVSRSSSAGLEHERARERREGSPSGGRRRRQWCVRTLCVFKLHSCVASRCIHVVSCDAVCRQRSSYSKSVNRSSGRRGGRRRSCCQCSGRRRSRTGRCAVTGVYVVSTNAAVRCLLRPCGCRRQRKNRCKMGTLATGTTPRVPVTSARRTRMASHS